MKNVKTAVQMLTSEQFRLVFGDVSEAAKAENDPVLDWYRRKGVKILSKIDMEPAIGQAVGLKRPDSDDYPEEDDAFYDDLDAYLDKWNGAIGRGLAFDEIVKAVVGREVGVDGFKLAGAGCEKVVFVDNAGHALKVGRWRDQSLRQEIDTSAAFPGLECFPRLLAHAPDKTSYMCECARGATGDDFRRLLGMPCRKVRDALLDKSGRTFEELFEKTREPRYKALADLHWFFGHEKELSDIDENNWGLAIRDGGQVLVVVDYDL